MKILSTLSLLLSLGAIQAQVVTYDIPFSQTIGLQQTTGDICSAPFNIEEAFQATQGNSWGFTWTSANSGTATSVDITLGFTVTDGGGTFPTTLNGSTSFNVTDGTAKTCENSTILTWSVDPANYNSGGSNTFMVDFATATNVSQVDNLPFPGDPFFRVTVNYTPCGTVDTSVTQNKNTLTANATNATYQWYDCEAGMIVTGETAVSFTPTSSGEYAVIVTDITSGCKDTSSCYSVMITGVEEYQSDHLIVYPNPANNQISVSIDEYRGPANVLIYDLHGRLVLSNNLSINGIEPMLIGIDHLPNAHYQLKVILEERVVTGRFVRQ